MTSGILMACYLAVNGQVAWIQGYEVKELRPSKNTKYLNERVLFKPDNGMAVAVNTNDCKYLEDPVEAYDRQLEAKKTGPKRGQASWCRVTNEGEQLCQYNDWRPCMANASRGEYCEPNKPNAEGA